MFLRLFTKQNIPLAKHFFNLCTILEPFWQLATLFIRLETFRKLSILRA